MINNIALLEAIVRGATSGKYGGRFNGLERKAA